MVAFALDVSLEGYEFRGVQSGVSAKTNKPWMSLILEKADNAQQLNVSVPVELQGNIAGLGLKKGDVVSCPVAAVATQKYSFVSLRGLPEVMGGVDY